MAVYESNAENEIAPNNRPYGYPQYAAIIAEDEDKSTTIYRRFDRLAARNLLYLETELAELEAWQDSLDVNGYKGFGFWSLNKLREEAESSLMTIKAKQEKAPAAQEVTVAKQNEMSDPTAMTSANAKERLEVAYRIRKTLKEYYEILKLESDILSLSSPSKRTLAALQKDFLRKDEEGQTNPLLGGPMRQHLAKKDLCVLAPPVERDRLTKFFEGPFSQWFNTFRVKDKNGNSSDFTSGKQISDMVNFISVIAATIFLVAALWGLYAVNDAAAQLIMLSCFAICFAACIALLTNARRQDVFVATAGYVAVLVVFVSTNMAGVWTPPASPDIGIEVTIFGASTNDTSHTSGITATSATATASIVSENNTASIINNTSSLIGVSITVGFAIISLVIVGCIWSYRHTHVGKLPRMRDLPI